MAQTILCIDDEPDVLTVLSVALRFTLGAEVVTCTGAVDAFRYLNSGGCPDIIVLDGMMPGIDGYQACKRLRDDPRFAVTPIVFLTARARKSERDRALAAGASACLAKPFDPMTVGNEIAAAASEAAAARHDARPSPPSLGDVHARYRRRLTEQADTLRALVGDSASSTAIIEIVHKVAGSAGSFGYIELSARAEGLESELRNSPAHHDLKTRVIDLARAMTKAATR